MNKEMQIQFLGGAGTVTGSKFLIQALGRNILVDCGLFQGVKKLRQLNWDYLPVEASEVDVVLLTHAHLDHTGYLPRLIKAGFGGKIYGTPPTLDIAGIILRDSAKIQMEEAKQANKLGYSSHDPAKPLYNLKDVDEVLLHFEEAALDQWIHLCEGIQVRFRYNGHILGAAFIEIDIAGKRLVFSGDIGRTEDVLLEPPQKPEQADLLFLETTYGDRLHPNEDAEQRILDIIRQTYFDSGTLIVPSFAVERTQTLMYLLWQLREKDLMPNIPVYMDSPMGADVLQVFHRTIGWHNLSEEDCTKMCRKIHRTTSFRETWEILDDPKPKVVIAGSGMLTGGRVLSYLKYYLERPETRILLVGFQAEGTRGRRLLEGATDLKIYGRYYPVKAQVISMESLSGHADQDELLDWLSDLKSKPEEIFLIHGEQHASDALRQKIKERYGWQTRIPELYAVYSNRIGPHRRSTPESSIWLG